MDRKKSSKSSAADDKHDTADPSDPGTLIAADGTTAGIGGLLSEKPGSGKKGKKKKGKKKKMTGAERELATLEKACDKIREDKDKFHEFINRMDSWLQRSYKILVRYFRRFDEDGVGMLTYSDFKSGLLDVLVPCTNVELHMLCKLLDRENTGDIDYRDFCKGLKYIRELEDLEREEEQADKVLILTEKTFEKCKCCNLSINGPYQVKYPKFILLELRLVTFNNIRDHPAHFATLIHAHIPVSSLHKIIEDETGIWSTKLSIFRDKSRSLEAMLPIDMSLQDLGYEGDTYDDPDEITLFYDYKVEFVDCPLLLCDHYFGQKVETTHTSRMNTTISANSHHTSAVVSQSLTA